jgi:hypothetical protein
MYGKQYVIAAALLTGASCGFAAPPVAAELVEVKKIWDQGPHNAFTDLARWNDSFYCAFREGRGHVSTDGKIRILQSRDTDTWAPAALVSLEGCDLRDAHLSVTPDGRLMLVGGVAPRKQDNQSAPTGTFVSFSSDGRQWSEPRIVVEPGRWLWCVTWNKGRAYGVSYTAGKGDDRYLDLLVSDDGIHYEPHVPRLFEQGYPTEVTLRFDADGTCYALVRRDRRENGPSSALLGVSQPDYKQWYWKDLGTDFNGFGGPNFIQIPGAYWLAAGRMHDGGAHTALCCIDVRNGTMTRLVKLPSGGDTSYPGLVWHNNLLYMSYYSSHEAKTSIYLAKLKIQPVQAVETALSAPAKSFLSAEQILAAWESTYGNIKTMRVSYRSILVDHQPPVNKLDEPSPVKYMHVERVEQDDHFHVRHSTAKSGFDEPASISEAAFDGMVTREYTPDRKRGSVVRGLIGRNTETMNDLKDYMLLRRSLVGGRNASGTYLIEDPNSKPQLSRTLDYAIEHSTASVRPNLESAGGQSCHVVETTLSGKRNGAAQQIKQVFWLAHDKSMCLMKYQWFWDDKLDREIEVKRIALAEIDGTAIWYPQKAYKTIYGQEFGTTRRELTVTEFVPNVKVDENTFRFDFPKGTDVFDRVRGISGVDLPREPPSLMGKPLPALRAFNVKPNIDQTKGEMILICFFDMQQRPSRNSITQLAKRAEQLKEKGVTIVAVQASKVDENTLNEWVKKNSIPFPVGAVQGDEEQIRFTWGVQSLPWLILTGRDHVVTGEGFGLGELDDKLKQAGNRK